MSGVFEFRTDNYPEDSTTRVARAHLRLQDAKKFQTYADSDVCPLTYCGENFTNKSQPTYVCIKKLVQYIDATFSPVPGMTCRDLKARTGRHQNIVKWMRDISLFVHNDDRSIFLGVGRFLEETNDYCPNVLPWYKFLSDVDHRYVKCSKNGCRFLKRSRPLNHCILSYQLKEHLDRKLCHDLTERIRSLVLIPDD